MKQFITIEQLKELGSEAEIKLLEWYLPKYGEFVRGDPNYQCYRLTGHEYGQDGFCKVCFNPSVEKKYSSPPPLLSIGQMIEFLDEKTGEDIHEYNGHHSCWKRHIDPPGNWKFTMYWEKDTELCDALWEAVKSIL